MRSAAFVMALCGGAMAAPAGTRVRWADWVGDYAGTLAWSNCTTAGAASAMLALDAIDGAMSIDLAPAGRALERKSLVPEETGSWSARDGDLAVTVTRPRANAIAVVVAYDSGCTMRARLTRATTRVPDCDRLLGWSRIAGTCSKRTVAHEDPAALALAKWRATDGSHCKQRSERIELALVEAACAPDPAWTSRISRACNELASKSQALARCGTVPRPIKDSYAREAQALLGALSSTDADSLPFLEEQCGKLAVRIAGLAKGQRCP